jgi:hypothetical protein
MPVNKTMPLFAPPPARPQEFKLSPTRVAQLAAIREKRAASSTMSERWLREREEPAFQEAMRLLAHEMSGGVSKRFAAR